jgi:hypothetical protein
MDKRIALIERISVGSVQFVGNLEVEIAKQRYRKTWCVRLGTFLGEYAFRSDAT